MAYSVGERKSSLVNGMQSGAAELRASILSVSTLDISLKRQDVCVE